MRVSAISLSSVPSPQRSSYYVLSHMNFWAVVERNAAYLFCEIWFANRIVTSNKSYCYFAEVIVTLLCYIFETVTRYSYKLP